MVWSFAAVHEPCDEVRVVGPGLKTTKININYIYTGELSKANVPVSHDLNPSPLPCLCTTNTIIKNNQAKSWLRISAVFLQFTSDSLKR